MSASSNAATTWSAATVASVQAEFVDETETVSRNVVSAQVGLMSGLAGVRRILVLWKGDSDGEPCKPRRKKKRQR